MAELPVNTLTAFFADEGDIHHDSEFVILDSGPVQPGTHIVANHPIAHGSYLEIIADKGEYIWQAEWHDKTGVGAHDGKLFRVILMPPIEYQDDVPVRRQFKVELIGDHELPSPQSS
jgi:hypothetical protein